jgi:hypothetical protein
VGIRGKPERVKVPKQERDEKYKMTRQMFRACVLVCAALLAVVLTAQQVHAQFDIETKITPSDVAAYDQFGHAVGISGNTAIVGAYAPSKGSSGSAYLFNATIGSQLAKLAASDAAMGDYFGRSVAISGNTAIVGAHFHNDNGTLKVEGSLDVLNNHVIRLTDVTRLIFQASGSSLTVSGATIVFDKPGWNIEKIVNYGELVLDSQTQILTGAGGGEIGRGDSTIINHGLVSARTPDAVISFDTIGLTNYGTMEARDGGTLIVPGTLENYGSLVALPGGVVSLTDSYTTADLGVISNLGGMIAITGVVDNAGDTITIDGVAGDWLLAIPSGWGRSACCDTDVNAPGIIRCDSVSKLAA